MSSYSWGFLHDPEAVHLVVVLLCTVIYLAVCGGVQDSVEYDACRSYRDGSDVASLDGLPDDVSSGFDLGNLRSQQILQDVCTSLNSFCFPSTLPGFLPRENNAKSLVLEVSGFGSETKPHVGLTQGRGNLSWSSDFGIFKLSSGRAVSCSLNFFENFPSPQRFHTDGCGRNDEDLVDQKISTSHPNEESEKIKAVFLHTSSLPHVEIKPSLLDWGQKYLNLPYLASLMVKNTHSDSILVIYEPYSTNSQFYPCNAGEMLLGPSEVASICFVFLPSLLGLSTAELILQTSSGGFLVHAKGFGIESTYAVEPIIGLDVSSTGRQSKNLSLFNPFNETLYVEEVTAWISVISGNISHSTEVACSISNTENINELSSQTVKKWLDIKNSQVSSPLMSMRPHRNWEVGPRNSRTVIELDFSHHSKGKVSGAFCIKLLRSSKDKIDTVVVPLEAELGEKSSSTGPTNPVSASFEALLPCDANGAVVFALSLRNDAPYLLRVVKINGIGESTKLIHIKYMEGLILFPGTVTQVAVVTFTPMAAQSHSSPPETIDIVRDCKLRILTNDSSSSQLEVPCNDVAGICSRGQFDSSFGHEYQSEWIGYDTLITDSLDSSMQSMSQVKALDVTEADELVLENWKSQATASGLSVLDDSEVLFSTVQVGGHDSKWITVKNPSPKPVVMQLMLNSGEIIDECRVPTGLLVQFSPTNLVANELTAPSRYGFSMAENAATEAYLSPFTTTSFGPVFFHPSNRCAWRSSALIRNNLSGVEWLFLHGFGGTTSLVLFEGSEPVQSLEFKFNLPSSLNFSPPNIFDSIEDKNNIICSPPLLKEMYAKNTGDLPLQVRKIEVSGTKCGLDGFVVHECKGFSLEPGESIKLLISYQADFSTGTVQRDLELALTTGILIIPMRASVPIYMLNFCKKSLFWIRVKRSLSVILLGASIMILVVCFIFPHMMAFGCHNYLFWSGKSAVASRGHRKSSLLHLNQKGSGEFVVSSKLNGLLKSIEEENRTSESTAFANDQGIVSTTVQRREQELSDRHINVSLGCQQQTDCLSDEKEMAMQTSSCSSSIAIKSYDMHERSQSESLSVKVGKEKGKRRRKKKSSSIGLTGVIEISSSQSGNSTPSSPLSPVISVAPKQSWPLSSDVNQAAEAENILKVCDQFEKGSDSGPVFKVNKMESKVSIKRDSNYCLFPTQEKSSAPGKLSGKPLLLPSATFPCTGKHAPNLASPSFLALTSTIAPHARAPGSKLCYLNTVTSEEKVGIDDEFKYDIWGDHLFGTTPRSSEVSTISSCLTGSNSDSFFLRSPQILVANSQLKSVSYQEG